MLLKSVQQNRLINQVQDLCFLLFLHVHLHHRGNVHNHNVYQHVVRHGDAHAHNNNHRDDDVHVRNSHRGGDVHVHNNHRDGDVRVHNIHHGGDDCAFMSQSWLYGFCSFSE